MLAWETRLARFVALLLLAAAAYGVVAGAHVTMYYDLVPSMPTRADTLGSLMGVAFLAAIVLSLAHVPLAAWDAAHGRWAAAAQRALAFIGPVIVVIGTEGVIAHFLWWGAISETGRYHLLHHALTAGVPLAVGYWIVLRWAWQPAALTVPASVSARALLASVIGGVMVLLPLGILFGVPSPLTILGLEAAGALALLALWFTRRSPMRMRP